MPHPADADVSDRFFTAWFAFVAILGLGFMGVMVWAIITLVNHFAH